MPQALVTGCAGFIGSHTVERLLADGYRVTGIDSFSKFYPREVKERNMRSFISHPKFRFEELDLRDRKGLVSVTAEYDIVVHLAAKAGVRPSIKAPHDYIDVNIHGTNNILEIMREGGANKLFFASSSSVYGNQKSIPFKEDAVEDLPISPYAYSKRAGELLCHTNHHLYNIDVLCARFFTVYGPRQRPDLAIHKFVKKIWNDEPIQMFGDGSTSRDYTFIQDTLSGIIGGIQYLRTHDKVFDIVNLGNNTPVKLADLIQKIGEAVGKTPRVEQLPMQQGDVDITYADITRAQQLLGYQPTTSIDNGLKAFVEWFEAQFHLH